MSASTMPFKLAQWITGELSTKILFLVEDQLCLMDLTKNLISWCKRELILGSMDTSSSQEIPLHPLKFPLIRIWCRDMLSGLEVVSLERTHLFLMFAIVKQTTKSMDHRSVGIIVFFPYD
jgi:hypothetical protein